MRLGHRLTTGLTFLLWAGLIPGSVWAQSNPVPFVNQPLVPSAVAPGGLDFTSGGEQMKRSLDVGYGVLVALLTFAGPALGQQPQAYYTPSGVGTATLTLAAGAFFCGNSLVTYAGGSLPWTGTTNYVFLDRSSTTCPPAINTTGFPATGVPIAVVFTNGTNITSITNLSTWFPPTLTTLDVSSFGGATADVQIKNCIAALPPSGGTCDARGLTGSQTWSSNPFSSVTKPVTVLLGAGTISVSQTIAITTGQVWLIGGPTADANVGLHQSVVLNWTGTGSPLFSVSGSAAQGTHLVGIALDNHGTATVGIDIESGAGDVILDDVVIAQPATPFSVAGIAAGMGAGPGTNPATTYNVNNLTLRNVSLYSAAPIGIFLSQVAASTLLEDVKVSGSTVPSGIATTTVNSNNVTGSGFSTNWVGSPIIINNVIYTVASVSSGTSLTITPAAQTSGNYSYTGPSFDLQLGDPSGGRGAIAVHSIGSIYGAPVNGKTPVYLARVENALFSGNYFEQANSITPASYSVETTGSTYARNVSLVGSTFRSVAASSGTVNTGTIGSCGASASVCLTSPSPLFVTDGSWNNQTIYIGPYPYVIQTVTDTTHLTLKTSAGNQTASYFLAGTSAFDLNSPVAQVSVMDSHMTGFANPGYLFHVAQPPQKAVAIGNDLQFTGGLVADSTASVTYLSNTAASARLPDQIAGGGPLTITKAMASGVNDKGTSSGSVTFDASLGNTQKLTLNGITTGNLINCQAGEWLAFDVVGDGTSTHTFTWGTNFKGGTNITGAPQTNAGEHNRQSFYCESSGTAWATGPMQSGT